MASNKTVIVTGASQGIGAAVVQAFLGRGYSVVATSRSVSKAGFAPSPNLVLVDGDIGQAETAATIVQTAISKFGSIDSLVNNAGVFFVKPFTDYTAEDCGLPGGAEGIRTDGHRTVLHVSSSSRTTCGRPT
jgi:NAD(P)-dependent dehydrogenase (short-subunit alcohol dehydrogenase family)